MLYDPSSQLDKIHNTWYLSLEHNERTAHNHRVVARSNECPRIVPLQASIQCASSFKCHSCAHIVRQSSFRSVLRRLRALSRTTRRNRGQNTGRDASYASLKLRLVQERRRGKAARRKLLLASRRRTLSQISRSSTTDALQHNWSRSDMPAVVKRLRNLREEGDFVGCETAVAFVEDVLLRLDGKIRGLQYNPATTQLAALMRSTGGCKLYSLISENLSICHERSVRDKISKNADFLPGVNEYNIIQLVKFYSAVKAKCGITGKIAYFLASDETACDARPGWHPGTDTLVMFCGKKCVNACDTVAACRKRNECPIVHQCQWQGFSQEPIGGGRPGHDNLTKQFKQGKQTTHARVVMVNPLHTKLPPMPIVFMGTCNAFTCEGYIQPQRKCIEKWCRTHLDPVLGHCVGWSSDGDSRRRKAALFSSVRPGDVGNPNRLRLNEDDFTHSAALTVNSDGDSTVAHIQDQDFVHNGKKLINVLCHNRVLYMGPNHIVTMNNIRFLINNCNLPPLRHGIKQSDVNRVGYSAMDWPSAERLISRKALKCLQDQSPLNPTFAPMHRYLLLCRRYVLMFQSRVVSWCTRVTYAAYVVTYLRLWRQWISNTDGYTLSLNFITHECFTDVKLSCHAFVLVLLTYQKLGLDGTPAMHRMGTDCCEDLFSSLGSWVMNKRIYTVLDGLYTLKTQLFVKGLQVESNFKSVVKNKRLRSYEWEDEEKIPNQPAFKDLPLPSVDNITSAWRKGRRDAYTHATEDELKPPRPLPDWWKNPWKYDRDHVDVDAMIDDDDLEGYAPSDPDTDCDDDDDDDNIDDDDEGDDADNPNGEHAASDQPQLSEVAQMALMSAQACRQSPSESKVVNTVFDPDLDANVHKLTVIASLYNGKKLSNDRGIRVRDNNAKDKVDAASDWNNKWCIGLYDDVGIRFENDNGDYECYFGRIIRIRRKRNRGWIDYVKPVDIGSDRTNLPELTIICYYYRQKPKKRKRHTSTSVVPSRCLEYTYDLADPQIVHIECVICPVTFTHNTDTNTFTLDQQHYDLCMQSLSGQEDFHSAWAAVVASD